MRAQPPVETLGIVLQRRIGPTADLYVLDPATGRLRRVTRTPQHESGPVWSPDGKRLAFTENHGGSELDVYTMRPDGSDADVLTFGPGETDK